MNTRKPETLQLEPSGNGGLLIWQYPEPGRKYVIGSDTAHGLAKGDLAASSVIDAETCSLVARWLERSDPHIWGVKQALLGWYYNEAVLCFETFPSSHGVTANQEASKAGYRNLYIRRIFNKQAARIGEDYGFATNVQTKPIVINRIKQALMDPDVDIPDEVLLDELRTRSWNAKGDMEGAGHDDMLMSYGIALVVRDDLWKQGKLATSEAPPVTREARYWAQWEKEWRREDQRRSAFKMRMQRRPQWKRGGPVV